MNSKGLGYISVFVAIVCLILLTACGHDQQLISITVQPATQDFGATNIPVSANAGANVKFRALRTYTHPPVTKDISSHVPWSSNTPKMVMVSSAGLLTATGLACGSALVSATVTT